MKILVFGLPGSGKTTYANELRDSYVDKGLSVKRLNADEIRKEYDDWDFSYEGRLRQARRMLYFSSIAIEDVVILDFVAPTEEIRSYFYSTHTLIWLNTISESRFEDTNLLFQKPLKCNYEITKYWK